MPIKVLYVAYRYDPLDPNQGSGADFQFHSAIVKEGFDVEILGPFDDPPCVLERRVRQIYNRYTSKRYPKFPISLAKLTSKALNEATVSIKPDVIFTRFPPSLIYYTGSIPCVYRTDAVQLGLREYGQYGNLGIKFGIWQDKRALRNCHRIITHSTWNRDLLVSGYGVSKKKVVLFPNPAALPSKVFPESQTINFKKLSSPLRLLFVGRDARRKGLDIAIEVVNLLNQNGIPTQLVVCGLNGKRQPTITYVGNFDKNDAAQLSKYVELYQNSHFLIHPARFDPSPIVTAEAAGFGVPTITNDVCGISTSVKNGVSGIVLPGHSLADKYVEVIQRFLKFPDEYNRLCVSTKLRFDFELNWNAASKKVAYVLSNISN